MTLSTIRHIGALLMIVSFALPLSRCEYNPDDLKSMFKPQELTQSEAPAVHVDPSKIKITIYHGYDFVDFKEVSGYIILITFFWPAMFFLLRRKESIKLSKWTGMIENLFALGGIYIVYLLGTTGSPRYGMVVYFVGALIFIVVNIRSARAHA